MSSPEGAFVLPVGTVTFLLTDVAGSTRLWESDDDDVVRAAIVRHYEILSEAVDAHGGVRPQEQGEGDSIVAAFARPSDALAAASAAQLALAAEAWPTTAPVRVRMAVHTGEAQLRDDANYAGQAIIRAARLRAVGHGGQVLVSGATRDLAVDQVGNRFELRSLGEHRLRDLGRPEHVWQLVIDGVPGDFDDLVSLDAVPNSLPVALSPFIGRANEIAELADLVLAERLVTATGTGGAGKTRLALQVGAEVIDRFPAGVWWVELAPLEGGGVESAVRAAFGISEGSSTPLPEAVRRTLDGRRCLLVVDNCEHVTDVVAPLLDDLLRAASSLHVLATSRVMLGLPGERAWRVPALALPEPGVVVALDVLSQFDAVRLFCDRARRARPNFELTTGNGPAVAEVCHRLGGIPLAIELAAARVRMLDPRRILDGLDDAFRLLAGGSKAVMARQQTLDASIAWSHDLLTPTEQALLRRLSVFVDGWTLEAAEAICPDPEGDDSGLDPYAVFDALDRLVDHSLVHTTDTPAGLRFGMLETIRQYAARQLAATEADAHGSVRGRHSAHYTGWAISIRDEMLVGGSDALVDTIEAELANVLAAVDHAITDGDGGRAARALAALVLVVDLWGAARATAFPILDRLDAVIDPDDEWMGLLVRARMLWAAWDFPQALEVLERLVASGGASGDELGERLGRLYTLALMGLTGAPVFDELVEVVEGLDECDPPWGTAAHVLLGVFAANAGKAELARESLAAAAPRIRGPILRAGADFVEGALSLARGEAWAAVQSMRRVSDARYTDPSLGNLALCYLAIAGADLGLDLTEQPEQRLRHGAEVEGRLVDGSLADGMVAIRHLLADELDEADEYLRRSIDHAARAGAPMSWPNEHYALVAAGLRADAGTEGGNRIELYGRLARAEQHLQRGDTAAALTEVLDSLDGELTGGAHRVVLLALELISRALVAAGRHAEATRVRGACRAFRSERSTVPYPCLRRLLDEAASASRDALGDDEYAALLADGGTMSLAAAADYARRQRVAHATSTVGWAALTPTEAHVAELVAEGLTNPQVAKELLMGAETVKTHLSKVFAKLGVANRKELIVAASRRAAERHR